MMPSNVRWVPAASRWLLGVACAAGGTATLEGCVSHANAPVAAVRGERVAPAVAEVGDEAFGAAVHDLLVSDPQTSERAVRLAAVEARQMARSELRFKSRAADRGLAAVTGGMYLVRIGDASLGVFGPAALSPLQSAVHELALRGDEGRALALYDILFHVGTAPMKEDARGHLAALDVWTKSAVADGGPVANAGAIERVSVRRRLLEPTDDALAKASDATGDWIAKAVALRDNFNKNRVQPAREEGEEAVRALETGPLVLAALYLRDADTPGALAALERTRARELLESERPRFAAALIAEAQSPAADRCVELLHQIRPLTAHETNGEDDAFSEDRELFGAAAFGVASDCYRLDPSVPEVALTLAVALEELGMAEAAPAMLREAAKAHPDARVLSEALALSLDAMEGEEDAGDPEAARRAFAATEPLLAAAAHSASADRVHPSPARLRASMGEIELREGHIDAARKLLSLSADQEKSGAVLLSLSRIEWRDGQPEAALGHLREALSAQDAAGDPALRGEILLLVSDVTHAKGDAAGARTPLTDALKQLVSSRNVQDGDTRARVERVLARVLDRFGAVQPAQRALERAYAAAPSDKHQVTQTIELLIGRAFVRGDLPAARDGLQRAEAADLDDDDLVYFALWVRLLERQLRVPTDGTADRVFSSVPEDGRWVGTLARFGEGKLKGEDLVARSATPIQKYEALFYSAMDLRAAGDTKGGDELLRQVVAGTGVELSEVTLARDILDPSRAQLGGPLPTDVAIP
jgi:tetratricopeptide (TPR) repeat protein